MKIKKGCLYSLGVMVVIVLAIVISWHIYCYNHFPPKGKKYQPVVNPKPQYFLTVNGFIDPTLKQDLHVTFQANYYTTNNACKAAFSAGDAFEGAVSYRQRNQYFTAKPDAKGKFTLKIPLDYYLPGFCGWQPLVILYSLKASGLNDNLITYFNSKDTHLPSQNAYQNIICEKKLNCSYGSRKEFRTTLFFRSNNTFNLIVRGENL